MKIRWKRRPIPPYVLDGRELRPEMQRTWRRDVRRYRHRMLIERLIRVRPPEEGE